MHFLLGEMAMEKEEEKVIGMVVALVKETETEKGNCLKLSQSRV